MKANNKNKGVNKFISILAIAVLVVSLFSFGITFVKVYQFKEKVTGYASGFVNLTIDTLIVINISRDTINWGRGILNMSLAGCLDNATLKTAQETASVTCSNYSTTNAKALIIQNLGNVNCSLSFQSSKNASVFFGGNSTIASYQWNFSNKDAGACGEWGVYSIKDRFENVSVTGAVVVCNKTDFTNGRNSMYMDAKLVIPLDANNTAYAMWDTITISGNTQV